MVKLKKKSRVWLRLIVCDGGPVRFAGTRDSLDTQGHLGCGWFRKILQRPYNRRICCRYLRGITMPGTLRTPVALSPLAGKPAPREMLVDIAYLERQYFEQRPDLDDPNQMARFGTSGHRSSPPRGSFTEAHILAIKQAICDYRRSQGTGGPLYMGNSPVRRSAPRPRSWQVNTLRGHEIIAHGSGGFCFARMSKVCGTSLTSRLSEVPASRWAWIRSAEPQGRIGSRSIPSTDWTSPS